MIPVWKTKNGDVFKFIPTGDILARVTRTKFLVVEPSENFIDEKGKMTTLTALDLIEDALIVDLKKGFYK